MPSYTYSVTNQSGKQEQGSIVSENRQTAINKLQEQGLIILTLIEKDNQKNDRNHKLKLSRTEKLMFIKNLSAMIGAGLTVVESLSIIQQQKPSRNMQKLVTNLSIFIKGGQSLANSLEYFKNTFSPIFINMVKVGEESGNLDQVLHYLEVQMEKDYDLIKKVKGAMVYPVVILTITFSLAIFLITFIIPKITRIFTSFDVTLPLPTRILIGTNVVLKAHGIKILIGTIALFFFLRWLKNRNFVKPFTHALLLKIPLIGKLSKFSNTARFARVLSSLLKSGVPLVRSLEIVGETLTNVHYQRAIKEAMKHVENGESLGQSLDGFTNLFPVLISRMIQVGEKTGTLEKTTENLADMFEKDVDDITKNMSTLMEPLLLLVMGVVVGGIALSIITPIYQIPQLIQKK